eukprot:gene20707-biopygen17093
MLATNSHEDYMGLCNLDVLGVEDKPEGDQLNVYEEFKEQLVEGENGDIKQAFPQIFIREAERDALRFFWIQDIESKQPIIYPVTRVLFGLGPSPFPLGGTLEQHLEKFERESTLKL